MRKLITEMTRSLLTDIGLKGGAMRRSTIGLAVFTSALLLLAFIPSVSQSVEVTIKAQSNDSDAWKGKFPVASGSLSGGGGAPGYFNAVIIVNPGDYLVFSNASGTWGEGNSSGSGPKGSTTPWPDNFFNLTDFGKVGMYEARTPCKYFEALVGYIGSSPPARGSYASPPNTSLSNAMQVFPVFPGGLDGGTTSVLQVKQPGQLWLAFNADAYSNYTVDNWGEVNVSVETYTGYLPDLDVGLLCEGLPTPFNTICWVGNQFVGGKPSWTSGSEGPPNLQEQVCGSGQSSGGQAR